MLPRHLRAWVCRSPECGPSTSQGSGPHSLVRQLGGSFTGGSDILIGIGVTHLGAWPQHSARTPQSAAGKGPCLGHRACFPCVNQSRQPCSACLLWAAFLPGHWFSGSRRTEGPTAGAGPWLCHPHQPLVHQGVGIGPWHVDASVIQTATLLGTRCLSFRGFDDEVFMRRRGRGRRDVTGSLGGEQGIQACPRV